MISSLLLALVSPSLCALVRSPCCQHVQLNVEDSQSEFHIMQGARLGFYSQIGFYGARPQYKQDGGDYFIFYSTEEEEWINTEFHVGNTTSGLANEASTYCVDSLHPWLAFNGSDWVQSSALLASCANISDTCCSSVNISTAESNSSLYSKDTLDSLGLYTAVGLYHGRYLYQRRGLDRYLLFLDTGDWMVTDRVGHDHGYLSHTGGGVCPEHTDNQWELSIFHQHSDTFTWATDSLLRVECSQEAPRARGGIRSLASTGGDGTVRGSDASPVIIVLSFFCLILITVFVSIFGRKFYKAWSHGAHGRQLFRESFSIN